MTTPPRTPTTAVEDLHAYIWLCLNDENAVPSDETLDSLILDIEAEAVAVERARLRAAVEGLEPQEPSSKAPNWYFDGWYETKAAVLALLEPQP